MLEGVYNLDEEALIPVGCKMRKVSAANTLVYITLTNFNTVSQDIVVLFNHINAVSSPTEKYNLKVTIWPNLFAKESIEGIPGYG